MNSNTKHKWYSQQAATQEEQEVKTLMILGDADAVNVDSLKGRNGDEDEARRVEGSLTEEARKRKRDSDDDGHVLDQGGDAATT